MLFFISLFLFLLENYSLFWFKFNGNTGDEIFYFKECSMMPMSGFFKKRILPNRLFTIKEIPEFQLQLTFKFLFLFLLPILMPHSLHLLELIFIWFSLNTLFVWGFLFLRNLLLLYRIVCCYFLILSNFILCSLIFNIKLYWNVNLFSSFILLCVLLYLDQSISIERKVIKFKDVLNC